MTETAKPVCIPLSEYGEFVEDAEARKVFEADPPQIRRYLYAPDLVNSRGVAFWCDFSTGDYARYTIQQKLQKNVQQFRVYVAGEMRIVLLENPWSTRDIILEARTPMEMMVLVDCMCGRTTFGELWGDRFLAEYVAAGGVLPLAQEQHDAN